MATSIWRPVIVTPCPSIQRISAFALWPRSAGWAATAASTSGSARISAGIQVTSQASTSVTTRQADQIAAAGIA